jgi:hypothetical protein
VDKNKATPYSNKINQLQKQIIEAVKVFSDQNKEAPVVEPRSHLKSNCNQTSKVHINTEHEVIEIQEGFFDE